MSMRVGERLAFGAGGHWRDTQPCDREIRGGCLGECGYRSPGMMELRHEPRPALIWTLHS